MPFARGHAFWFGVYWILSTLVPIVLSTTPKTYIVVFRAKSIGNNQHLKIFQYYVIKQTPTEVSHNTSKFIITAIRD